MLLLGVPLSFISVIFGLSDSLTFISSFIGLIPLASLLGDFTEDIAIRTNEIIGALINVTLGNATEVILSIAALRKGMLSLIKLSLFGSVIGNMLLVMGMSILVGSYDKLFIHFDKELVNVFNPLLLFSCLAFVLSLGSYEGSTTYDKQGLLISREISIVCAITYISYLIFQLYTHKSLFSNEIPDNLPESIDNHNEPSSELETLSQEEEEETPNFTFLFAFIGLVIIAILIAILSESIVNTIDKTAESLHIPHQFVSAILIPITGNAAEHFSAIVFAKKNKLNLSIGVAIGSSVQIALFVMPILVICGWMIGQPLDLNLHPYLTVVYIVSVLIVQSVTHSGRCTWLSGLLLMLIYILIGIIFLSESLNIY